MGEKSGVISFYADSELDGLLREEAKKRGISKHALAKFFTRKGLQDLTITHDKKINANLRIDANTFYILRNGLILLIQSVRQDISHDEAINMVNEQVLSGARDDAAQLLKSLGIED
ncbi:hypothetical protein [Dickeya sp. NCPPB 3274]|uniref:hypothetical protein n=1 Tax=Dickeya sp. NCPPB 3274 TaxID=568766 RepID=UPI0005B3FF1A|nr:hypothetical protein [Dickeya sp. NCPPB 3274]